jgi:hypothetical protein
MSSKISALPAASTLTGSEVVPGVQAGGNVAATVQQLVTAATGSSAMTGGTVAASAPLLNHAQTWNNSGATFTGWKLNVTDTASASASLLADLQVGSASKFRVDKGGTASLASALRTVNVQLASGDLQAFANWTDPTTAPQIQYRGAMFGGSAGALLAADLIVGWSSATWGSSGDVYQNKDTGLARNAAGVAEVNNGTRGTFRDLKLRNLMPQVYTVATLPSASTAGAGARSHVSDANAPAFGSTVASGGAVSTPVYSDGSAWRVG